MTDISKFNTNKVPTWCPGCANFFFLGALKKALAELDLKPEEVVATYDIGCAANMVNNLNVCGFATLHGRSIPVAVGVKMANPNLKVIAQGGEGGILTEGGNHLIHAAQRDDNITVIINNNFVFGLTTGQASSGTPKGVKTRSTPGGNPYESLSGIDVAAAAGETFLARTLTSEVEKTKEILKSALSHPGFALVEVVGPCVIWTKDFSQEQLGGKTYLEKPLSNPKELLGKNELLGILFQKN